MYEHVLVPTDGSAPMRSVANEAIEVAAAMGATIHALYVVDERTKSGVRSRTDGRETDDSFTEVGDEATADIARWATEASVPVEEAVVRGVPHEEILAYADEIEADVIIMGTHGRTGLDRLLLGSVADRVIRLSPIPVMTVKLTEDGDPVLTTESAAERAKEAVTEDGMTPAGLREEPYRERATWVVPVDTEEGTAVNVHIEAATGRVRVAHLD